MYATYSSRFKTVTGLSREAYGKYGIHRFFVVFDCGRVEVYETSSALRERIKSVEKDGLSIRTAF